MKFKDSKHIKSYILILVPPTYIYSYYYNDLKIPIEIDQNVSGFEKEYYDLKYKTEGNNLYVYIEI